VKRSELTHEYMKGNCHEAEAEEDGVLQLTVSSDTAKTKTTWVLEQVCNHVSCLVVLCSLI
jgi:hypothetical protein